MDSTEQAFQRIAAEIGKLRPSPPWWQRAAEACREAGIVLLALGVMGGILTLAGAAARLGWEWAG